MTKEVDVLIDKLHKQLLIDMPETCVSFTLRFTADGVTMRAGYVYGRQLTGTRISMRNIKNRFIKKEETCGKAKKQL